MRAAAGASLDSRGAAGLMLVVVLAGLAVTGMLYLPSLVSKTTQRNNTAEEAALARLEDNFCDYVRLHQTIPSTGTWATALGVVSGLNVAQANSAFPAFPTDASVQRAFVVDDYLGGGSPLLPYTQSTSGLTSTQTNLLNSRARAMIVSSAKRGLALPVSSGFITQTNFDAIWNWTYDRSTKAPPSGWSSTWTGMGDFLHVKHIYLPSLFSKVTLQNTKYGVGVLNVLTTAVSSQTDYYFLNGTPLTLATTAGVLKQDHVVRGDASFNFGSSSIPPIIWFRMEETSGTYASNSGSLGEKVAGTISSGVGYGQNGPQPPTYPNFSDKNYSMDFSAYTEYISTKSSPLSGMKAFTLGCWVSADAVSSSRTGLIGQNDSIELGFISSSSIQLWTPGGGDVTVAWPFAKSTWHHITATGDGKTLRLYFDGKEVKSASFTTSNYGSSSDYFHIGSTMVFDGPGVSKSVFDGMLDEVVAYDRALSAAEALQLSTGLLP